MPDNSYLLSLSTSRQNCGRFSTFKCKWECGLNPQRDGAEERVSGGLWSLASLYRHSQRPSPSATSEAASWDGLCFNQSWGRDQADGNRRKRRAEERQMRPTPRLSLVPQTPTSCIAIKMVLMSSWDWTHQPPAALKSLKMFRNTHPWFIHAHRNTFKSIFYFVNIIS